MAGNLKRRRWPVPLVCLMGPLVCLSPPGNAVQLSVDLRPNLVTLDDPATHVLPGGGPYDGVGFLRLNIDGETVGSSGTLLWTGRHLLTAAHSVVSRGRSSTSAPTRSRVPLRQRTTPTTDSRLTTSGTVIFYTSDGPVTRFIKSVQPHPAWTGNFYQGNDLAIVELDSPAPSDIHRYQIYTGEAELGQEFTKVGFGLAGQGRLQQSSLSPIPVSRAGRNKYDATHDGMMEFFKAVNDPLLAYEPGAVLQYDFDDGLAAHDAFGVWFGLNDPKPVVGEANAAPGDSGGPSFIFGNLIAGITSYGIRWQMGFADGTVLRSDTDTILDSSVGEFSADTRVSHYADWILAQVPEHMGWWAPLVSLGCLLGLRRFVFAARPAGSELQRPPDPQA